MNMPLIATLVLVALLCGCTAMPRHERTLEIQDNRNATVVLDIAQPPQPSPHKTITAGQAFGAIPSRAIGNDAAILMIITQQDT